MDQSDYGVPPKDQFLYDRNAYQGEFTPERLIFDANLQEFTQRVAYLCALENGGKISAEEAYCKIKALWKQLKRSKNELGIGKSNPPDQSTPSGGEMI